MTKEIFFDLEFTEDGVVNLSTAGYNFLANSNLDNLEELYRNAIDRGLHVRFQNKQALDRLSAQSLDSSC